MKRLAISKLALAMMGVIGVSALFVSGAGATAGTAGADASIAQRAQVGAPTIVPGTYAGKITSNTNAGLTIHGNDNVDRTVLVQPGAVIQRDGKTVNVNDLKTGDSVNMSIAQNGVVQSIAATSPKSSSGFNPLWLLLLLLLLIPLLLWLLSRRKKDDFVMERNTGTTTRTTTTRTAGDGTAEKDRDTNARPRM